MGTVATSASASTPAPVLELPADDVDLLGHVVRLEILVGQVLDRIAAAAGISGSDYLVLGVVRRSPGQRSAPTAIAEVLGRTTGGMTLTLDRLERSGWVRRLPDPDDRRRVVVEATADGLALATRVNDDLHRWEASLGATPTQRRRLAGALGDLTELIEAAAPPAV